MKISSIPAFTFLVTAVTVGIVVPAGFSPAGAVESNATHRGNGDQTQTQTAAQTPAEPPTASAESATPTLPALTASPALKAPDAPAKASPKPATTASRAGLRIGRPKLQFTGKVLSGVASFYGSGFHGRRTFSGERFNMYAMTLACRRLPMGTRVRVTNLRNGKTAIARVNDRGPNGRFHRRVADLSKGLARKIGFVDGLTKVRLEVVK